METTLQERIERVGPEVARLVAEKNRAYGSAFEKTGAFLRLLFPNGIRPDQYDDLGLQFRIFDKQMRIATRKGAFGESPFADIAGYGILGAAKDEAACARPAPGAVPGAPVDAAERIAALEAALDTARADLESHVKALDARLAEVKRERDELALALHRAEEQRDAARHNLKQARADLSAETAALAQLEQQLREARRG
jgi:hypothetical protein